MEGIVGVPLRARLAARGDGPCPRLRSRARASPWLRRRCSRCRAARDGTRPGRCWRSERTRTRDRSPVRDAITARALAIPGDVLALGGNAGSGPATRAGGAVVASASGTACSCTRGPRADGRASTAPSRAPRARAARSDGRSCCRAGSRRARARSSSPAGMFCGQPGDQRVHARQLVGLRGARTAADQRLIWRAK